VAGLARELGVEVRSIEYMPLDSGRAWSGEKLAPAMEIVEWIGRVCPLVTWGERT
jgi:molybdenum cofactor biosynthesis enzyme MoaA